MATLKKLNQCFHAKETFRAKSILKIIDSVMSLGALERKVI